MVQAFQDVHCFQAFHLNQANQEGQVFLLVQLVLEVLGDRRGQEDQLVLCYQLLLVVQVDLQDLHYLSYLVVLLCQVYLEDQVNH